MRMPMAKLKRALLLSVAALAVLLFFYLDLQQWLSLDGLKATYEQFQQWQREQPLLLAGGFFIVYVLVTALSLPGAAVMTLAAGALFGLGWGTLIVSFASSLGATLAFLLARYLFGDAVQRRFADRLQAINRGMAKDGAFYLFTLRLLPIFPFFLINLLMALTPIGALRFYWVSQLGMLAGTLVYVNAGTQLAQLDSLSGILSPGLLLSFALLGLFPWLARGVINQLQARRRYRGFRRPRQFDRNLIVIGAGAGGLVSAYIASAVKAKVSLIEAGKMGGDCLNYGCVPSKALIRSARLAQQLRRAGHYGLAGSEADMASIRAAFPQVMRRVQQTIQAVAPHDSVERYTDLGVEVLQGYARLLDPWTVEIALNDGGCQRLTARSIIIATGAEPTVPAIPGIEHSGYLTSDTLWEDFARRAQAPRRLLVLGGGPIGCELAQSFARLGLEVTLVQRAQRLLPREDDEVSALAKAHLERDGVRVLLAHQALRCEQQDGEQFMVLAQDGRESALPFDALLCATGRSARLQGYGLEALGINTECGLVSNDYLQTLYPNIYAAGDVAGPYQFTHAAAHQAWYAAVNALFGGLKKFKVDYRVIPRTTFIDPEVAAVGLNERQAIAQGIDYELTRFDLAELDRAITDGATAGFIKVLTVPGKDRILGATVVGEHAGELLAEFVLAMRHGLGLKKILATIHSYPTWSEANKYTAGQWQRAHTSPRLLRWLQRYHRWRRG